jgi:hypothetical protein
MPMGVDLVRFPHDFPTTSHECLTLCGAVRLPFISQGIDGAFEAPTHIDWRGMKLNPLSGPSPGV